MVLRGVAPSPLMQRWCGGGILWASRAGLGWVMCYDTGLIDRYQEELVVVRWRITKGMRNKRQEGQAGDESERVLSIPVQDYST